MFNLEKAINQWLRSFRKYQAFDHGSVREMELHLRDHIDDLVADEYSEQEAFEIAVKEFGDIKKMAFDEFQTQKRKSTIKSFIQTAMFKNYSLIALRSMMKNPVSSLINLFGLSMAIGLCVFAYAFAQWVYSTDQFHEFKDEVHLITYSANSDGNLQVYGQTPRPLGEMLKQDFPQVQKVCRMEDRNVVVKYEDNVYHERVRFTDEEFLEMFTFPLKWGSAGSLADMNSIILSEEMSIKYFGDQNPVGLEILLKFDESRSKVFKITGVAEKFPVAKTIAFSFLINFQNLSAADQDYNFHDWTKLVNATFIQIKDPKHLEDISEGMEKYRLIQNEATGQGMAISSFGLEPFASLHKNSEHIRNHITRNSSSNYSSIVYLVCVSGFILLLSCINYINIAIVSAAKRLKELGIRKTIGASKANIIIQFLTENIVITLFALILGLALGMTLFIPWFEGMWGFSMGFSLGRGKVWAFLAAIVIITGLISGSYPAFYISKFQVTSILKGSLKFGRKNTLTKAFLGVQLIVATIFITLSVAFTLNTNYLKQRSWGYDNREVIYVAVQDQAAFEKMQAVMAQDPNVISVSGSSHHVGRKHKTTIIEFPDRQFEVNELAVGDNYVQTLGLTIKSGRGFNPDSESDKQAVLVNETFVKNMTLQQPIGQVFRIDSIQYEIIGVVRDFHSYNFAEKVNPTILRVAGKEDYAFLSMRITKGTEHDVYKNAQSQWVQLYPEIPFNGGYQEDAWGAYYETIDNYAEVWTLFASIAIILAILGLYGLVKLNVEGRIREFSIKKVLGAGLPGIADGICRQYILLLVMAIIIGAPTSYFLVKMIFGMAYAYHMPLTFEVILLGIVVLIVAIIFTIGTQIRKVMTSNPVEGLRVE